MQNAPEKPAVNAEHTEECCSVIKWSAPLTHNVNQSPKQYVERERPERKGVLDDFTYVEFKKRQNQLIGTEIRTMAAWSG